MTLMPSGADRPKLTYKAVTGRVALIGWSRRRHPVLRRLPEDSGGLTTMMRYLGACRSVSGFVTLVVAFGVAAASAHGAEWTGTLTRDQLADHARQLVGRATNSIYVAATDCTLSLFSADLRTKAVLPALVGKVALRVEQTRRCPPPAGLDVPRPFDLKERSLAHVQVDAPGKVRYRREIVIVDGAQLLVALSDLAVAVPPAFTVYQVDVNGQAEAATHLRALGAEVWPEAFRMPQSAGVTRSPRWSTDNHRRITREVLSALGFGSPAISVVERGNVHVDRLTNQFNNPQHSMRNLGQTLADAQHEATEWITARAKAATDRARRGASCCALFALGEALHTIQDRKHNWIFLYQHLLEEIVSDYKGQGWRPDEWKTAHAQTESWCHDFLARLRALDPSLVDRLQNAAAELCRCDAEATTRPTPPPLSALLLAPALRW